MELRKTQKAMDLAVKYLSFKARTEFEMVEYLKKKNMEEEIIDHVIAKLREYRYVNDEIYLKNYVEYNRQVTRYGSKRICQDLGRRGISDDLLLNLEDLYPQEDEQSCCEAMAEKNQKKLHGQTVQQKRKKLYDSLSRLGYPSEMISRIIRTLDLEEAPIELSEDEIAQKEMKALAKFNRDYEKYERTHKNKGYHGKDLEYRISKSLMGRGYPFETIKEKIAAMKEE
ncbi:MAG: hypothetical protein ACOH15_03100 [Acetobacterium sp.]